MEDQRLVRLASVLSGFKLSLESSYIYKLATTHGIQTLGYDENSARIINEVIGDKWGYVIAKWIFDSENFRNLSSVKDYVGLMWGGNERSILSNLKAASGCGELIGKSEKEKEDMVARRESNNIKTLERMYSDDHFEQMIKPREWSKEDLAIFRMESSPTSDQRLIAAKQNFEERSKELINSFVREAFFEDLFQNKWISPAKAKKLTYKEAVDAWIADKTRAGFPLVLEMEEGWKWVDAGGGRSDWVRKKMENCGNCGWENLSAIPSSKAAAKMLLLIDSSSEPHIIVTWNPEYREDEVSEPKKILSGIEGKNHSVIREAYYPYIMRLINHLKPDKVFLSRRSQTTSDGEFLSNEGLEKTIDEANPDMLRK